MGMNKILISLLLVFFAAGEVFSQVSRYVIYLEDKENTRFSLEKPEEFLSERAILRRQAQQIAITENDFPVNQAYVDSLTATGANYLFSSKWFNAVLIEANEEQLQAIMGLSFYLDMEYAAPNGAPAFNERSKVKFPPPLRISKKSSTSQQQNEMLGVNAMHNQGFTGEGLLIGVFDGGFQHVNSLPIFSHIYTNNRLIAAYDFVHKQPDVYDFDDHGTRVLSCIASYEPDMMVGTAYDASFVLCVTEDVGSEYRVEEYNWLFAAEYADSIGVDIINTSLGYNTFNDPDMNYTYGDLDGETAIITQASNLAASKGILLVNSAGNEGNNNWKYITPPSDNFFSLSVGAVTTTGELASFSSKGPTADGRLEPDVLALGAPTIVGKGDGTIGPSSGTSFAAPLVAGLAAGLWQANPSLSPAEIMEKLRLSGNNSEMPDTARGFGIPHFERAQEQIILGVEDKLEGNFQIYPNPTNDGTFFLKSGNAVPDTMLDVLIHKATGELVIATKFEVKSGDTVFTLPLSTLPDGIYLISITSEGISEHIRLIKN